MWDVVAVKQFQSNKVNSHSAFHDIILMPNVIFKPCQEIKFSKQM